VVLSEFSFPSATLFWNSMSKYEQDHIVTAYSFELGKVDDIGVGERVLAHINQVWKALCSRLNNPMVNLIL
jgi:catalase